MGHQQKEHRQKLMLFLLLGVAGESTGVFRAREKNLRKAYELCEYAWASVGHQQKEHQQKRDVLIGEIKIRVWASPEAFVKQMRNLR